MKILVHGKIIWQVQSTFLSRIIFSWQVFFFPVCNKKAVIHRLYGFYNTMGKLVTCNIHLCIEWVISESPMVTIQLWAFNFSDMVNPSKKEKKNRFLCVPHPQKRHMGCTKKSFLSGCQGYFLHSIYWWKHIPYGMSSVLQSQNLRTKLCTLREGPGLVAMGNLWSVQ